jgi:hypothetical protein
VDLDEFLQSVADAAEAPTPAPQLSAALRALWHVGRRQWHAAHAVVQAEDDADSAWVHAHLHRVEGDLSNARYWYARARRAPRDCPLEEEWREMVVALLARQA